jgi:hypothetical protein
MESAGNLGVDGGRNPLFHGTFRAIRRSRSARFEQPYHSMELTRRMARRWRHSASRTTALAGRNENQAIAADGGDGCKISPRGR